MAQEPGGVLIVNKHAGVTSHHIVGVVRRLYNTRRVGHAGTLDPMATGVLVVLIGRAAKASEYLSHDAKHYRATLRLGLTTDTEDTTGTVLTTSDNIPNNEELQAVLPRFRGKILQTPPMYSALKVDGQKLVDLARRGEIIEREAREIEIFSLEATPTEDKCEYILDVHCSGGTYIRTLCADIGAALGCGGAMATLERGEACGFDLTQAHTVDDIEAMTEEERLKLLIPTEKLFSNLPQICLSPFFEKLSRSGCEIYLKKIGLNFPLGTRVSLCDANGAFFALGEVGEFKDGIAVKAIKMFVL
ncbi:MAG: tRNA pseudouridine(55) synthase TruB [Clostridia bacterium]|nr:tRNA pseudouridine(55) synthase TruB [Clostridia bacterium]